MLHRILLSLLLVALALPSGALASRTRGGKKARQPRQSKVHTRSKAKRRTQPRRRGKRLQGHLARRKSSDRQKAQAAKRQMKTKAAKKQRRTNRKSKQRRARRNKATKAQTQAAALAQRPGVRGVLARLWKNMVFRTAAAGQILIDTNPTTLGIAGGGGIVMLAMLGPVAAGAWIGGAILGGQGSALLMGALSPTSWLSKGTGIEAPAPIFRRVAKKE